MSDLILIDVSSQQNDGLSASYIFNLLRYCAHFVSSVHENDVNADIPLSILESAKIWKGVLFHKTWKSAEENEKFSSRRVTGKGEF